MNYVDMGLEAITATHPKTGEQPTSWWMVGAAAATAALAIGAIAAINRSKSEEELAEQRAAELKWLSTPVGRKSGPGAQVSQAATQAAAQAIAAAKAKAAKEDPREAAARRNKKKRVCQRSWEIVGQSATGPIYGEVTRWVDPTKLTAEQEQAAAEQKLREAMAEAAELEGVNAARKVAGFPPIVRPSVPQSQDPEAWKAFRQALRDWDARIAKHRAAPPVGRHIPGMDPWHAKASGKQRCHDDSSGSGQDLMRSPRFYPSRPR